MATERPKSSRARLFVALDPPEDVRAGLAAWQARDCRDEALRPVGPEALHVTLCFLGPQPESAIERIVAVLEGIALQPVEMRLEPVPVGVGGSRPTLFAVAAPSEAALRLQGELSRSLVAERLYEPSSRPFWPHVTVARVRSERPVGGAPRRRGRARPRVVERPPGPLPAGLLAPWGAVRVALYRSHLRSTGARYERLATLELPPATSGRER